MGSPQGKAGQQRSPTSHRAEPAPAVPPGSVTEGREGKQGKRRRRERERDRVLFTLVYQMTITLVAYSSILVNVY